MDFVGTELRAPTAYLREIERGRTVGGETYVECLAPSAWAATDQHEGGLRQWRALDQAVDAEGVAPPGCAAPKLLAGGDPFLEAKLNRSGGDGREGDNRRRHGFFLELSFVL